MKYLQSKCWVNAVEQQYLKLKERVASLSQNAARQSMGKVSFVLYHEILASEQEVFVEGELMKSLKSFFLRKKTLGIQRTQKTMSKGTTTSEPWRVEGYLQNTFFSTDVFIERSITVIVFSLKKFGIRNSIREGIFKRPSVCITPLDA